MTRKLRADNRLHVVVHRVLLIKHYVMLFVCHVFVLRIMYFWFLLYICAAYYILVLHIMYFLLYTAYFIYRGCFVQNIINIWRQHISDINHQLASHGYFLNWPPPFSAPKSQLELLLHDIVYLREPLVCSLTYFILCTQLWCEAGSTVENALYNCEYTIHKVPSCTLWLVLLNASTIIKRKTWSDHSRWPI